MAEKILNSRMIQKHDTEENWKKAINFIPKQGEIILYDADANYNYSRMKIGDGKTVVEALPFTFHQEGYYGLIEDEGFLTSANCLEGTGIQAKSYILAQQEGSGDASPTNIRAITGWDTLTLTHTNRNLVSHYDVKFTQGHKNAVVTAEYIDVVEPTTFDYQRYDNIKLKAGQPYTYVVNFEVYGRDEADTRITSVAYRLAAQASSNTARDIKANGSYTHVVNYTPETDVTTTLLCYPNFGNNGASKVPSKMKTRVMLVEGTYTVDNAPAFVPCVKETLTAELPETIYGGTIDWNTGLLTVEYIYFEKAIADMDNINEDYPGWRNVSKLYELMGGKFNGEIKSNVNNMGVRIGINTRSGEATNTGVLMFMNSTLKQSEWKAQYPDLVFQCAFKINVPYTYQLTPQQIEALQGVNTIWSDCGNTRALFNCSLFVNLEAFTDEEIDEICGANIVSSSEVTF